MKSDEFHRLVEKNGWTYLRKIGSHVIYKKGSRTYPVPYHGAKEIGTGLAKKIIREMGLKYTPLKKNRMRYEKDCCNH